MDVFSGLWRQPAFVLVWTAQTVSQVGSQVTLVALPLTAILVLGASPDAGRVLDAEPVLASRSTGLGGTYFGVALDTACGLTSGASIWNTRDPQTTRAPSSRNAAVKD